MLLGYGCIQGYLSSTGPVYVCEVLNDTALPETVIVYKTKQNWRVSLNLLLASDKVCTGLNPRKKNPRNIQRLEQLAEYITSNGYPPAIVAEVMTFIQLDGHFTTPQLKTDIAKKLIDRFCLLANATQIPAHLKLKLLPGLSKLDIPLLEQQILDGATAEFIVALYAPEN